MIRALNGAELLVVTGKGGVGKTLATAVLAAAVHRSGRRVLALESDPRESLHPFFGAPPSGHEIVEVRPGLRFQNLEPAKVVDRLVEDHLPFRMLTQRMFTSPVYRHFVAGAPGLEEMALLGHALEAIESGDSEMVIIDAPASGHGLSFLDAPRLVAEVIPDGPVGTLATRLASFIDDGKRTAVVVVTLAEEMPVQETLETLAALKKGKRRVAGLIVNGLLPDDAAEVELLRERHRAQLEELERLKKSFRGKRFDWPLLPLDRGPALVEALS